MFFTIKNSNIQDQDEPPSRYQIHNALRKRLNDDYSLSCHDLGKKP